MKKRAAQLAAVAVPRDEYGMPLHNLAPTELRVLNEVVRREVNRPPEVQELLVHKLGAALERTRDWSPHEFSGIPYGYPIQRWDAVESLQAAARALRIAVGRLDNAEVNAVSCELHDLGYGELQATELADALAAIESAAGRVVGHRPKRGANRINLAARSFVYWVTVAYHETCGVPATTRGGEFFRLVNGLTAAGLAGIPSGPLNHKLIAAAVDMYFEEMSELPLGAER